MAKKVSLPPRATGGRQLPKDYPPSTDWSQSVSQSELSSMGEDEDYFTKFNSLAGWQSILLVQFQVQMQIAIFCSIYFSYICCMFELALGFGSSKVTAVEYTPAREATNGIIYTGDVIYAMDCLSMLIFKRVKWNEISYRYKARSKVILAIEILSLIPLEPFYSVMVSPTMKIYAILRLRYALRLVRLHSYFIAAKDYVGTNTYLIHLGLYIGGTSLVIVTTGAFTYIYKCGVLRSVCDELNYDILAESLYLGSAQWIFSSTTAASKEWIWDSVLLSFVGFLITAFFTGFFVCSILRRIKAKCHFINMCMWRKRTIAFWKKDFVKDWTSYHKKYEAVMEDYATILWERTQGNSPSFYLWKFLPAVMYKEIFLDISWVPLKHSHLFQNEDVFFLRLISQNLEQRFFCPGEIIYKRNKFKTRMVYIVSGTIDILSEEDGETPIMSLSSGSCIGESSLIIGYPSTSTVVSKDMCDVVMFNRRDFIRLGMLYPDKMRRIFVDIQTRYKRAKSFQIIADYQFKRVEFEERVGVLTMKWLKHTLRTLLFNVRKVGDLINAHYMRKLEENVFCTKYLDLLAQAEDEDFVTDAIFIRTEFPFVLRPNSVLIKLWNAFVLITLAYLLVTYPWFMIYYVEKYLFFDLSFGYVSICWIVDLYLRSSIAIKSKYYYYNTVADIIVYNLSSFTFFLDILAAIPWEVIMYLIEGELSRTHKMYASVNRLIKVYKLEQLFTTIKINTRSLVYLTMIKFCTYLFILLYYLTALCFLLGNLQENYEQFIEFTQKFGTPDILRQVYVSMFGVIEFYGDLDVTGFPFSNGYKSLLTLIGFQYILVVFNACFIAYLSAMVTMDMMDEHRMKEYTRNMAITMTCFKLDPNLQKRVWRYIKLQYKGAGVYFIVCDQVFAEIPRELAIMSRGIHLGEVLKNHQLFFYLEDTVISRIAYIASVHLVPENEVIKQIGEMCPEIYILRNGVCRIENYKKESQIIKHQEVFNALEACLEIKSLVTITTETPCLFISISVQTLKAILLRHKVDYDQLQHTIITFPYMEECARYAVPVGREVVNLKVTTREYKYFGYFLKKRTKRYATFQEGFTSKTAIFKFLLMRVVFSTGGRFVFYWELSRAILAFLSAIIVPITEFFEESYSTYVLLCLDFTAYVDLYMRHHLSYYDDNGVEIRHPMNTARYYWKHAFVVDLFACAPIDKILPLMFSTSPLGFNVFKYNRFLQLYRYQCFISFIFDKKIRLQPFIILKYIPSIIIVINLLASIFLKALCTVNPSVSCNEKSSIHAKITNDTTLYDIYGLGIYITTISMTYTNHFLITIGTNFEIAFIAIVGFIGIVGMYLLLAKVIETKLSINRDLSAYQEAMQRLNQFMSYRKIDKHLKTELINHFEYRWKRTKGKSINRAFQYFKRSFKVEALYNIYGIRFQKSTIFPSPNEGFFRSLLLEVKYEMYLKRGFIYRVNDVNDDIYILLKGVIDVVGADGNKLVCLTVGSVFGNLDNCPLGRRTLSMVAASHVEVLKFSSTVFHKHLANFDHLRRHFLKLTCFDVDYLREIQHSYINIESAVSSTMAHRLWYSTSSFFKKASFLRTKIFNRNIFIEIWEKVIVCYVSYLSYFVELYHLTTLADSTYIYMTLYAIDLIFLIKIYMMFHTAYEDESGQIVRNRKAIAKRYITMKLGFLLDVFTTLPFDALIYFCYDYSNMRFLYPVLRLNRFPRVLIALDKLKSVTEKLNVIVLVVRMWYLTACTLLIIFTLGSTLLFFDYVYYPTVSDRMKRFLSSIQFAISSCISTSKVMPKDQQMLFHWSLWVSVVILISKVVYILFITECCSILVVVNRTRNNYEQFMIFIKAYLRNENVSIPLAQRIVDHSNLLWAYHKGVQYPSLLEEAPYYLKEAVLNSMFVFQLDNHPILKHLHKDLARQMTANMKTLVFFPGDKVAYVGDIDRCMYFIDTGEVVALSEDTMYSEIVEKVLHAGDMFGLKQGLLYNHGHSYTYKATMYTVLAALKRDDWIHLLDFYPASKYIISEAIGIKLDRVRY